MLYNNYRSKHSILITGMLKCLLNLKRDFKNSDVHLKTALLHNKKYIKTNKKGVWIKN